MRYKDPGDNIPCHRFVGRVVMRYKDPDDNMPWHRFVGRVEMLSHKCGVIHIHTHFISRVDVNFSYASFSSTEPGMLNFLCFP